MMKTKRWMVAILCLSVLVTGMMSLSGCGTTVQAANLMEGIAAKPVSGKAADDAFKNSSADFAIRLFQKTRDDSKNSLISPLSVMLALSMTANGAKGETLAQMEALLGGDIPMETLNEYLYSYIKALPSERTAKLNIANSIWFRDNGFAAEKAFLQKNADYYGAAAYKSVFNEKTLRDINNWVKMNTDGMIEKIIDDLDPDAVMYLINTVLFDAEWKNIYKKDEIRDGTFTALDSTKRTVSMMYSEEHSLLTVAGGRGFIKNYDGGNYAFVAVLPDAGTDISEFVSSLDAAALAEALKKTTAAVIDARIPEFRAEYGADLKMALGNMGITRAFEPGEADFSGITSDDNIYIGSVMHRTVMEIDRDGTKAAASTVIAAPTAADPGLLPERINITLDRPFVYMIIDRTVSLPVFIGVAAGMK